MNLKTQQSRESWAFFLAWLSLPYSLFSFPTIITFLALTAEFITTHNPSFKWKQKSCSLFAEFLEMVSLLDL